MERNILRVLVLVLLAAAVGIYFMTRSTVMLHLPDQQPKPPVVIQPANNGQAGGTSATGAPPATGPQAVVKPQPVGPTGQTGATQTANPLDQYFISLDEAKKLFDAKKAIFIDAREYVEYTEGHIQGAMSLPKRRFDGAVPKPVREYLPGAEVVVYCHGADCTDSEAVVKRLIALNMNIGPYHIIKDGFPGWQDRNKTDPAGFPIDKGGEVGFQ
jgi:rhodanese-related sulfurtransferase